MVQTKNNEFMNKVLEMSDVLYQIKEKIKDNEYMVSMNKLNEIQKLYNELNNELNNGEKSYVCKCPLNSDTFCSNGLKYFVGCNNLQPTLARFPILRNLVILYSLPQKSLYKSSYYYKSRIQFTLIKADKYVGKVKPKKHTEILYRFLELHEAFSNDNVNVLFRFILTIALFDYLFKNSFLLTMTPYFDRYSEMIYNKLNEFNTIIQNESKIKILKLITKIYKINENPYILFSKNLLPHRNKKLLHKQLLEKFTIKEPVPEEPVPEEPVPEEPVLEEPVLEEPVLEAV